MRNKYMQIKTNEPIIKDPALITQTIANFWNKISNGWRSIWGPHIHHGFYENNDNSCTPLEAQEKLIDKLAEIIDIKPQDKILDVGCGMGGSSIYLTKKYFANLTGITLSHQQILIANELAINNQVKSIIFKLEDAHSLISFQDNEFDIVWSLESCEQFYDKNLFFENALRVLKPGGKLMLATWCSDQEIYEGKQAKKYKKLCFAFDVPYMPTINQYRLLLEKNFAIQKIYDWSAEVKHSWDIGMSLTNARSAWELLKMGGWRGWRFAQQIKLMHNAFQEGRVKYGVFFVKKPL